MNLVLSLFSHSFWSIVIGLMIVAAITGATVALLKGYNPRARLSGAGIVSLSLTSVLLAVQIIPAVAAFRLKSTVGELRADANTLIASISGGGNLLTSIPTDREVAEKLEADYPLISQLAADSPPLQQVADLSSPNDFINAVADSAISSLNSFILKELLIALVILAVGTTIAALTLRTPGSASVRAGRRPLPNNTYKHKTISHKHKTISHNGKPHFNRSRRHRL